MFKNLFLLFKNINLSINILGCLIIKYLYNFSFGMQFSRYIVVKAFCLNSEIWRFELQHLSSSPKEYLMWNLLWKHYHLVSLDEVYLFSNLRLRFRSSSLRKQCIGIHLLSHTVSGIVPSADQVLTIVFGMGTGVSPRRIDTNNVWF